MASALEHDRHKLQFRLAYLQALLAEAEVKAGARRAVASWAACIRCHAGYAQRVLDGVRRREAAAAQAPAALRYLSARHNPLLRRRKSRREIRNMARHIDSLESLIDERVLGLLARTPPPRRESDSLLYAPRGVHGRGGDVEAVVALLLELGQRDRGGGVQAQVLAVTGARGVGKTTLAKVVYNDARVREHFDLTVWLWASPDREPADAMRGVIWWVTDERCDLPEGATMEALRRRAAEAVAGRRLLVVLDDVWSLNWRGRWEDVVRSLRRVGGPGSAVVVTTRSRRVAALAGTTVPTYELRGLGEDDAWELLRRAAFGVFEDEDALREEEDAGGEAVAAAGRRIAGKCGGVPLALITMGEFMREREMTRAHEWERVAECDVGGIVEDKLIKAMQEQEALDRQRQHGCGISCRCSTGKIEESAGKNRAEKSCGIWQVCDALSFL